MTVKNTRPEWQLAAASADATRRQSVISEGLQTQRKIHELVAQHRSKLRSMIGDKQIKAYDAHRKTLNHRLYEARPVGFATERELQRWYELRRQIILESRQFLSEIGIGDETLAAIRKELSQTLQGIPPFSTKNPESVDEISAAAAALTSAWSAWHRPPYLSAYSSAQPGSFVYPGVQYYYSHSADAITGSVKTSNVVVVLNPGDYASAYNVVLSEVVFNTSPQAAGFVRVNVDLTNISSWYNGYLIDLPGWSDGQVVERCTVFATITTAPPSPRGNPPALLQETVYIEPIFGVAREVEDSWVYTPYPPGHSIITQDAIFPTTQVQAGQPIRITAGVQNSASLWANDMDLYSAVYEEWVIQGVNVAVGPRVPSPPP